MRSRLSFSTARATCSRALLGIRNCFSFSLKRGSVLDSSTSCLNWPTARTLTQSGSSPQAWAQKAASELVWSTCEKFNSVHKVWTHERQLIGLVHHMGHQKKCRQTVSRRTARMMLFTKPKLDTKAKVHVTAQKSANRPTVSVGSNKVSITATYMSRTPHFSAVQVVGPIPVVMLLSGKTRSCTPEDSAATWMSSSFF